MIVGLSKDGSITYFFWLSKAHELNPNTPFTLCEDKKRKFITPLRPHKRIWNFIEDDEEHKVPHVLRANADPN